MSQTFSLSNQILGYNFGMTSYTPPANYYLALSTTSNINPDGTGFTEITGGSYTRVQIPNNTVSFSTPVNGVVKNAVSFQFAESTASWGTILSFGIYDALTGGSLKIFGNLTYSRTVDTATVLVLEVNALEINIQNIV